jgi:hypothetical protein
MACGCGVDVDRVAVALIWCGDSGPEDMGVDWRHGGRDVVVGSLIRSFGSSASLGLQAWYQWIDEKPWKGSRTLRSRANPRLTGRRSRCLRRGRASGRRWSLQPWDRDWLVIGSIRRELSAES